MTFHIPPEWLSLLNHRLFDTVVGVVNEADARVEFASAFARAIETPHDYDKARDLFLIATLERVIAHGVVQPVIDLLRRRMSGEDVSAALVTAANTPAINAATAAAAAAANGRDNDTVAYAAVANLAADANIPVAYAAVLAAIAYVETFASARADLITALNAS